ncbi:MAG: EAL domain-containing protein [Deltaproteobacteria bacterium]|nr:EAL domain-containing protein [Deltaproteobacteria bacterium]
MDDKTPARITKHKKSKHTLMTHSHQQSNNLLQSWFDWYWEQDSEFRFTHMTGRAIEEGGSLADENLLGKRPWEAGFIIEGEGGGDAFRKTLETHGSFRNVVVQHYRPEDETNTYFKISGEPCFDDAGSFAGYRGMGIDITEYRQADDLARHNEENIRTVMETIRDGYVELDLTGRIIYANDAVCRHVGLTRGQLLGLNNRSYTDEATAKRMFQIYLDVYKTGAPAMGVEVQVFRQDGTPQISEISISLIRNSRGKPIGFRNIARDITERIQMEESLRQSEERYRTIIEEMEEWYFETDLTGNIIFFNEVFADILGRPGESLTGLNYRSLIKEENWDPVSRIFDQVFKTGQTIKNLPYEFTLPDGSVTSAEFSIFPKRNESGVVVGFRGVGHDITERRRAEEQIEYLAMHDSLTGLPNRIMFSQLIDHTIRSSKRFRRQFAVLFLDLDRFKVINDTLGHEGGDRLLQETAKTLKQVLREMDVVARLGGDEFIILIAEFNDLKQVSTIAQRILSAVMKPHMLMGHECRVTASIGISTYPNDADDAESLIKYADIAMYLAKEEGKNNYQFYSSDIESRSIERAALETNLRFALERNEFFLHYQAKLDFKTGKICGVEALLRWQNPVLGNVPPARFISTAEETGLIVPIGRWVLGVACAQNAAWQRQGLPEVCMSVNLAFGQIMDDHLIEDIRIALKDSGMRPNLLELEITESMLMRDPDRIVHVLTEIKKMGVRLAIDNFGTGYSSLAQLKRFPIDTIKVDRSFIKDFSKDAPDMKITEAIIAMGKMLSLTVVAEGVEIEEQDAFLRSHACDEMQGYYFSKPTPPDQFAELLGSHIPAS